MKQSMFIITLLVLLYPSIGFCQEDEKENEDLIAAENQLELRRIQLEFQEIEAKAMFRQQERELDLKERRIELGNKRKNQGYSRHWKFRHRRRAVPFFILCIVIHILVAVWVYRDIQKRKQGSGIWIVVALLTGLLGVLVYAVVRLGDSRQT